MAMLKAARSGSSMEARANLMAAMGATTFKKGLSVVDSLSSQELIRAGGFIDRGPFEPHLHRSMQQ